MQLPSGRPVRDLSRTLSDAGYTVEGVRALLGTVASEALDRNAAVPARQVLADDHSALGTAVRLLLLGVPVTADDAAQIVDPSLDWSDLLQPTDEGIRSVVEIAPYAADRHDWLIASDWAASRTGRATTTEHVLGVGGASTMLAQCTVRPDVARALDVGTGCGIQAFHLAQHSREVVATDISSRCLEVTRFNSELNDIPVELRQGSLLDPVLGERFDLIVSNPPFVIASPREQRHDYRDSGLVGDEVCARLVRGASERLTDGGWCQLLANWEITDGSDWPAHARMWLDASPLDAWTVQRHVQDPAEYVETWLRDAGDHWRPDYDDVYAEWLKALERRGVLGVGFGLITLRQGGSSSPIRRFQHAPQTLVQPVGPDIARWFAAQDGLAQLPGAEVLLVPWRTAADVEIVEEYSPAGEVQRRSVTRREGFAWSGPIDEFGVDLLARADGTAPLVDVVLSAAAQRALVAEDVLASAIPVVRQLVAEGFLSSASLPGAVNR